MLIRSLIAFAVLCTAFVVHALTIEQRSPWTALAAKGLGERSYAVRLKQLPVGQLVQSAERTVAGNYRFSSRLEFQLAQGQPVRVFETKLFSGLPPFALLAASQNDTTAAATNRVTLSQSFDATYQAVIERGRSHHQQQTISWQHTLADYLAVENWLGDAEIDIPATFRSIDFDSLTLRRDQWTLLARTAEGFEVTKSSRLEATRLFLDRNFKPLRFSMAGTFEIESVPAAELPIAPEPVFHSQTYQVPINEPIERHQSLSGLTLRVLGNTALVARWENATGDGSQTLLRSVANHQRDSQENDRSRFTREELSYPISAASVVKLASQAVDPLATQREQAQQLTGFVHNYINYDHHSTMQNVLDVIRNQSGDCNEYAELFTALGRALGLPVRTVIGLAYTDERAPAFALHAWNEVLLEERWSAFDPTWNQTVVDATHLPLPDDAGGMLQGITALDELQFEVVSLRY